MFISKEAMLHIPAIDAKLIPGVCRSARFSHLCALNGSLPLSLTSLQLLPQQRQLLLEAPSTLQRKVTLFTDASCTSPTNVLLSKKAIMPSSYIPECR